MPAIKVIEDLLKSGKITRREFMTRISAFGMATAVSPLLLAHSAQAASPKKGGRLRAGMAGGATTDTLDPATMTDYVPLFILFGQLRNCLTEVDYQGNVTPEAAESWETSKDAKQWIFNLRKGIDFHSGKTMDAEDVIFSINHHRKEASKSGAKALLKSITDIKADGKQRVIFTLGAGDADFPYIVSDYHLQIMPNGTTDFDKGDGTGPYILVKHEPGVRCITKRNSNYWKAGCGHFDEVETICISDVTARTNALKSGQVDYINRCERKTAHLLKRVPGIQLLSATGTTHFTLPMLADVPPFDNNDVRLALKYAVDREELVKRILRGFGQVGNDHPIGPNQRYFASELPQRTFDPEKARFHMKKAGMEGETLKLHVADAAFAGAVDTAVLLQNQAAKAGIKIEVVREPDDGYWSNVWMKKPWSACYWGGRPTEDLMFSIAYASDAAWNDSHWKHKHFDKLLLEARAELNDAKRRQMYAEMQRIVRDEGSVIIPMFASIVEAASTKLKYVNYAANYESDGGKLAERWWFA
jgi:peptide/nickel transport system substrate-binding protein